MKNPNKISALQEKMVASAPPKPRRGRPARPLAAPVVCQLAAAGLSNAEIGRQLGCSTRTLARRCGEELRRGRALITAHLKSYLVPRALFANDRQALLLLARHMKWDI